jgi:hypothetical protein
VSRQGEKRGRDHVVTSVLSLLSARDDVGAFAHPAPSLLALSTVPSGLHRTHDALGQNCGAPPSRPPSPLRPRARKSRARCCRRGEVEDAMIQGDRDDARGVFIRISIVSGVFQLLEVLRACRPLQAEVLHALTAAGASFSSCLTRHPSHEVMLERGAR